MLTRLRRTTFAAPDAASSLPSDQASVLATIDAVVKQTSERDAANTRAGIAKGIRIAGSILNLLLLPVALAVRVTRVTSDLRGWTIG
jgi:hypothetical protein